MIPCFSSLKSSGLNFSTLSLLTTISSLATAITFSIALGDSPSFAIITSTFFSAFFTSSAVIITFSFSSTTGATSIILSTCSSTASTLFTTATFPSKTLIRVVFLASASTEKFVPRTPATAVGVFTKKLSFFKSFLGLHIIFPISRPSVVFSMPSFRKNCAIIAFDFSFILIMESPIFISHDESAPVSIISL
jgi:hypothetical protein